MDLVLGPLEPSVFVQSVATKEDRQEKHVMTEIILEAMDVVPLAH